MILVYDWKRMDKQNDINFKIMIYEMMFILIMYFFFNFRIYKNDICFLYKMEFRFNQFEGICLGYICSFMENLC